MLTKNFKKSEFSCSCGCGEGEIDIRLVHKLQRVRDLLGEPIKITSGVRCPTHNTAVGGSQHSSHLYGFAADLYCPSSAYRFDIIPLINSHFTRIGIGPDFIHCDIDNTKQQDVIWVY